MNIQAGKKCYLYNSKAKFDVCTAHILHVMPHPERKDDILIVYRWYGKHKQWWHYDVTSGQEQDIEQEYVQRNVEKYIKRKKKATN